VLDRTNGKLLNAFPMVEKITWASKLDLKTGRPVETGNRPGDPADAEKGTQVFTAPSFLGAKDWMPMAYNPDRPVLRADQRMGHGALEPAHRLQEGHRLSRRRLHHQAGVR
jgi:hypothetical protein